MSAELFRLFAALASQTTRADAARKLAGYLGAQELFVCLFDADVGILLPAPGFCQRLPDANWWPSFLAHAIQHEQYIADVPATGLRAHSFRNGDAVLIIVGAHLDLDAVGQLSVLLPLLTAVLQHEQLQKRTESRAALWHETAGQAQLLAQSLDAARKDLQEALSQTESLRQDVERKVRELELIYQTAPMGLCLLNAELEFLRINEALAKMTGLSVADCLGRRMDDVMPEAAEVVRGYCDQVFHSGSAVLNTEVSWTAQPDTTARDWIISYYPLRVQGSVQAVNCIVQEVTEQKTAEREIRRLLHEAEQRETMLSEKQAQLVQAAKLSSIGEMATGVAHELNNPLNNINLYAGNLIDRLEAGASLNAGNATGLRQILQQVQKASKIVNQLRRFGGQARSVYQTLPFNAVVESSLVLMQEQFALNNIALDVRLSSEELFVFGDPIELEQVLINLLTNARDALFTSALKHITVRTSRQADTVRVTVKDSGVGIPRELQERIFDPFFSTKDVGKGTGLGLSISYGIIKDHKGEIWVESQPEKGTTFYVNLPAIERPGRSRRD